MHKIACAAKMRLPGHCNLASVACHPIQCTDWAGQQHVLSLSLARSGKVHMALVVLQHAALLRNSEDITALGAGRCHAHDESTNPPLPPPLTDQRVIEGWNDTSVLMESIGV